MKSLVYQKSLFSQLIENGVTAIPSPTGSESLTPCVGEQREESMLIAKLFSSPPVYLPTINKVFIVSPIDTVRTTHVYSRKLARIYPVPNRLDVYL